MEYTISSQAWDVPHSRMVVTLRKMQTSVWGPSGSKPKIYYVAGVSMRLGGTDELGFTFFNEKGDEPYNAFESLMGRIDKAAGIVFDVIDRCEDPKSVPVVKTVGWESAPPKDDDFAMKCFSSLSRAVHL